MKTYALYLESGPKHRKTMVHVPELLGCIAAGPTTEEALEATPAAIRLYLRFLERHGEEADPDEPFETHVAEHITEGDWLGNGSPYLLLETDRVPLAGEEIERYLRWFHWMREDLAVWAGAQDDAALDAIPQPRGRPARQVLLHMLNVGGYLGAALGGAPGFFRLQPNAAGSACRMHCDRGMRAPPSSCAAAQLSSGRWS